MGKKPKGIGAVVDVPADPAYDSEDIKRINDVIANARPTWFALLGALVFCGITLLGVKDLDFFAANQRTQLPLVNVSVPVISFFYAGCALATALYVYLHLYLELLWTALATAKARYGAPPNDDPISEHIVPWQVAEWGLRRRDALRRAGDQDRSSMPRNFAMVGTAITIMFVWGFGPLVVGYFWWRSMPAHNEYVTLWLALLFWLSILVSVRSARAADSILAGTSSRPDWYAMPLVGVWGWRKVTTSGSRAAAFFSWRRAARSWPAYFTWFVGLILLACISLVRTASELWPVEWQTILHAQSIYTKPRELDWGSDWSAWSGTIAKWLAIHGIARADLREARLSEKPDTWLNYDDAQREYRAVWAKQMSIPYEEPFPESKEKTPESEFEFDWERARNTYLATIQPSILDGRNLRGAILDRAFLPGAMLRNAKLDGATLAGAVLDGSDLSGASLGNTVLLGTSMHNTTMTGARLIGSKQKPIVIYSYYFKQAKWPLAFFQNVALGDSGITEMESISYTIGDSSVSTPLEFSIPCRWVSDRELTLGELVGRQKRELELFFSRFDVDVDLGAPEIASIEPDTCRWEEIRPPFPPTHDPSSAYRHLVQTELERLGVTDSME